MALVNLHVLDFVEVFLLIAHIIPTFGAEARCREHLPRQPLLLFATQENFMAIEARETGNLISSDKVQGTAVYGPNDEKVGSITSVMIEKVSASAAIST